MQELAVITSAYISLYSWVSNRRGGHNKWGGCHKWGGWQKSPKLINREVGINGEAGKNRHKFDWNKIIKWSCENINKKNIGNTMVVYLHEESLVLLLNSRLHATSCFIVIRKQFCTMWLFYGCRISNKIHATQKNT